MVGPRVLLTGGGTGGHIYPALAVAEVLDPASIVGYIGAEGGLEASIVPDAGLELFPLQASGVIRKRADAAIRGAFRAGRAILEARRILRSRCPDIVLGTGGYVTGPVGVAARLEGIPLVVLEENAIPGVTNRMLGRMAVAVAVPWEDARGAFPPSVRRKVRVTGNPVRSRVLSVSREEGRRAFDLPEDARVVLLFGGSQGAVALNRVGRMLAGEGMLAGDTYLLWACGVRYFTEVSKELGEPGGSRVRLLPYLNDMPAALAAADLAVTRAGAMTLAELTARGVPSVLIPSPNVTHDHQTANARVLVRHGAARVVAEDALSHVRSVVYALLKDDGALRDMSRAARNLGRPDAAQELTALVLDLARSRRRGRPGDTVGSGRDL